MRVNAAACNTPLEHLRQIFGTRSEINHEENEQSIAELDKLTHELMETVANTMLRDRNYNNSISPYNLRLTGPLRAVAESSVKFDARPHRSSARKLSG